MQSALQRYLTEQGYNKNMLKDQEFHQSRKILEGKAKQLREQGMGKKKMPVKQSIQVRKTFFGFIKSSAIIHQFLL